MANDTVQVTEGTGPKIQTFSNTVGGVAGVETQAVALVDQLGTPLSIDAFGRQVIADLDSELNLTSGMTNYRERVVGQRYTVLSDSIADGLATFWTQTNANGGSVSIAAGEGAIQSGTTATGSSQLSSTAPPYLPGQSAWLLCAGRFGDTGSVGNVRRLGAFTVSGIVPQDGFYYELASDSTFNAVSVKAGVVTSVASTSWSRGSVAPFTLDVNYHLFELRWTANRADFYIDNVLRHTASVTNSAITATLNFPMTAQSVSTSGTTNRTLVIRNIGLGRFGTPDPAPFSPDTTMQSAAAAVGNGVAMNTAGFGTAALQITGTFVGTLTFEGTFDGTNYSAVAATQESASTVSSIATTPGIYRLSVAGLNNIRARVSAFTSGTITVVGRTLNAPYAPKFNQATAITKAVQGATGVTTQDLKDAGRSARTITLDSFAIAATTEALMTMSYSVDNAVPTTGTSYNVTTGKRLRVQTITASLHTITGNTTIASIIVRIRALATGPALVGSPLEFLVVVPGVAGVNAASAVTVPLPDGWEVPAGAGVAITAHCAGFVATTAAPRLSVAINAYEY